jgi:AcrR family transcriptional regulator
MTKSMKSREIRPARAPIAERLIDVAEELFGVYGLDAVSLRQVSAAAGSANNYAVQYHFGDLPGLIRAILETRMPDIERKRAQMLARLKSDGRLSETRALMDILYLPLIEHQNTRGDRNYARLILALQNAPSGLDHARDTFHLMPIAEHVVDLIAANHFNIPPPLLGERHRLVAIMVLSSLFNRCPPFEDRHDKALVRNVLDMATSALLAPIAPAMRKIV